LLPKSELATTARMSTEKKNTGHDPSNVRRSN
jgi:hypothetical protein